MLHIWQDKRRLADLCGKRRVADYPGKDISVNINHDDVRYAPAAGLR